MKHSQPIIWILMLFKELIYYACNKNHQIKIINAFNIEIDYRPLDTYIYALFESKKDIQHMNKETQFVR